MRCPHLLGHTAYSAPGRGGQAEEGSGSAVKREAAAAHPSNLATECTLEGGGQPPSGVEGSPLLGEEQLAPAKIVGESGSPRLQGGDGGPAWSLSPAWSLWSYTRIPISITEEIPW